VAVAQLSFKKLLRKEANPLRLAFLFRQVRWYVKTKLPSLRGGLGDGGVVWALFLLFSYAFEAHGLGAVLRHEDAEHIGADHIPPKALLGEVRGCEQPGEALRTGA